jgi:hypothetical protein
MAINGIDEKILFQRGNPSKDATNLGRVNPYLTKSSDLKRDDNTGVLVIDPNKVVNSYNEIVDRYVKQEDMAMYASLKVYKRAQAAVLYNEQDGARQKESISEPIYINFLNPLSKRKREDGSYYSKGKMTSEWTDFFTSDAANDKTSSQYILDPETFGITNISIKINANHLPIVTIEFTDVQGRMLFERGNDKDNPYNIFYTYPYPKFMLTYKGYYGKAVETPLVLLKSNTKFDPATGNYNVTAEFQSEIFALFNTFLLIYGYVAPYMFKLDDGQYLGAKILKELYDKQNNDIRELVGEAEYDKYKIESYPTLFDLSRALKDIPADAAKQSTDTDESIANNNVLLENKIIIENYEARVREYITKDPEKYSQVSPEEQNTIVYKPINAQFNISGKDRQPSELFDYLDRINEAVTNIGNIKLPNNQTNTFYQDIIYDLAKNNDEQIKLYTQTYKIGKDKILNGELFQYKGKIDVKDTVYLDVFNTIIGSIFNAISKIQATVEEEYVNDQIRDLGVKLGYQPNFNNILRILANNMQVFLILLEITGKSALTQLSTNTNRLKRQSKATDYPVEFNKSVFSAFPNYYKVNNEVVNGKTVEKKTLAYPGVDTINNDWFEVAFVEEIYKALDRIKQIANPSVNGITQQIATGLLTPFQLGENVLTTYPSKEYSKVLGEVFARYAIYAPYSGLLFKGLSNFSSNVVTKLADFELDLMDKNVFSKIQSTQNKFVVANEIKLATESKSEDGITYTNVGNFGIKFIGFGDRTYTGSITALRPIYSDLAKTVNKSYTESEYSTSIGKLTSSLKSPTRDNGSGVLVGIRNQYLYDVITYKKSDNNINLFSVNSDKKQEELKHLVDLTPNFTYYCDNSDKLGDLSTNLQSVDANKGNANVFQGFYSNMNISLGKIRVNTDLSRGVNYALSENAPALTFNSTTDDYLSIPEEFAAFKPAVSSGDIKHHVIFNKL